MRYLVCIVASLVVGCATLPPECRTEYSHTIAHCPDYGKPRPRPPKNEAECKQAGGVSIIRDGRFEDCVHPDSMRDILRGL